VIDLRSNDAAAWTDVSTQLRSRRSGHRI